MLVKGGPGIVCNWLRQSWGWNLLWSLTMYTLLVKIVWYNNKTVLLRDTVHQISRGESEAAGLTTGQPLPLTPEGDLVDGITKPNSFIVILWCQKYKVQSKFTRAFDVAYVSDSRFRKLVIFLMWRHHDMALWCHGGGTWHNGLILMTASNGNSWADVAHHMTRLWQAGDMEIFEYRITG